MRALCYVLLLLCTVLECSSVVTRKQNGSVQTSGKSTISRGTVSKRRAKSKPTLPPIPELNESTDPVQLSVAIEELSMIDVETVDDDVTMEQTGQGMLHYDPIRGPDHRSSEQTTHDNDVQEAAGALLALKHERIDRKNDVTGYLLAQVISKLNTFQASEEGQERLREAAQVDKAKAQQGNDRQDEEWLPSKKRKSRAVRQSRSKKPKVNQQAVPGIVIQPNDSEPSKVKSEPKVFLKLSPEVIRKALLYYESKPKSDKKNSRMAMDQDDVYIDVLN